MSLLWQLLIEMLSLFFEPTRLLGGVSWCLHGEFSLFFGEAEFQLAKVQENLYIIFGGIRNFRF